MDAFEQNGVRQVVPVDGGYRYVIASVAEDLSGKVNVNTAMEAFTEPTRFFPIGMTPASVDLHRMLTMADIYGTPGRLSNRIPGLSGYDAMSPRGGADRGAGGVRRVRCGGCSGGAGNPFLAGSDAFGTIIFARDFGRLPVENDPDYNSAQYAGVNGDYDAGRRYLSYAPLFDGVDDGTRIDTDVFFSIAFGIESEFELRTFNRLNDPSSHTKLERAMEGPATQRLSTTTFDPFRTNRPFDVERDYHDLDPRRAAGLLKPEPAAERSPPADDDDEPVASVRVAPDRSVRGRGRTRSRPVWRPRIRSSCRRLSSRTRSRRRSTR